MTGPPALAERPRGRLLLVAWLALAALVAARHLEVPGPPLGASLARLLDRLAGTRAPGAPR